jgi:hypothetical protein
MQKRDAGALTGALFVVLVLVAFIALGGDTPEGDASARKVVSFYSDHENKEIGAAVVLALSTVPLLFFTAILRDRLREALPDRSVLPAFALAGGALAAAGFAAAAAVHFALADYSEDLQPAAAQALNALDGDFFLPFTTGLAVVLLAASVTAIRTGFLPKWLGWVGILMFVAFFTPAGFISFGLMGIWIIAVSIVLYLRGAAPTTPAT